MGNRTTVADNATLNETRIAEIGADVHVERDSRRRRLAMNMGRWQADLRPEFLTGSLRITDQRGSYYVLQLPAGSGFTAWRR